MRKNWFLLSLLVVASHLAIGQHPLVATWEMVSIAGVNVDGKKFKLDTTTIRETKIITPTHYMLIAMDSENGKWSFNRCYAGKTKMDGDKYNEIPVLSSNQIYDNVTTDFHWKIDGNSFIQSGKITRPDGKEIKLDKFVFKRSNVSPVSDPKFVGSWQTDANEVMSILIITTTHWMLIEHRNQKFSKALGGVYAIQGDRADLTVLYGSEKVTPLSAEIKGKSINLNNLSYSKID